MRVVSGKRMCKVLESKGWRHSRTNGSHRIYVRAGSSSSIVVPVHGNADLATGTQRSIMRQAALTDADL